MWLFLCGAVLENGGHVALFPVCLALLAHKCLGTVLQIEVANWNIIQKSVDVLETWVLAALLTSKGGSCN